MMVWAGSFKSISFKSQGNDAYDAVLNAIDIGYRHFDTAYFYQNEDQIGKAIQEKINEGVVTREDLFITTKLWTTFGNPKLVKVCLKKSLESLKLDYVDLYLMHWPIAIKYYNDSNILPMVDGIPEYDDDVHYCDTWKAMEGVVNDGLTKSIGVCNFNTKQVKDILDMATIKPATVQIESHPYLTQKKMAQFCKDNDIIITAYSPFSNPDSPFRREGPFLLEDEKVKEIAEKYGKTPAQILIRFQIELGNMTIPKSVNKSRMEENFNIFDFEISEEDMDVLNGLNKGFRTMLVMDKAKHWPFGEE